MIVQIESYDKEVYLVLDCDCDVYRTTLTLTRYDKSWKTLQERVRVRFDDYSSVLYVGEELKKRVDMTRTGKGLAKHVFEQFAKMVQRNDWNGNFTIIANDEKQDWWYQCRINDDFPMTQINDDTFGISLSARYLTCYNMFDQQWVNRYMKCSDKSLAIMNDMKQGLYKTPVICKEEVKNELVQGVFEPLYNTDGLNYVLSIRNTLEFRDDYFIKRLYHTVGYKTVLEDVLEAVGE